MERLENGKKLLRVNLTTSEIKTETIDERTLRRYYGGGALATSILLKELEPGIDPLGEENLLVFTCSVLTGTIIPGASRYTVAAKSPLTNAFAESEAGGFWGPELAKAGYIGIVVSGKAPKPSYLWIKDGEVEIRDAQSIWGKTTGEAQEIIRKELDDQKIVVAQTGPAGEKLVRYACVVNNLKHANGRTGMGAVFGSKNLRAIAVRGTQEVPVKDREKLMELVKWFGKSWKENAGNKRLHDYGTAHNTMALQNTGTLPTNNWKKGEFEGAEKICGESMTETVLTKNEGCYLCPVKCKRVVGGTKYNIDPEYGGPEYETIGGFGSICGVDDLAAIAKGHEICNAQGVDTISASIAVAWAMECYEKGILTKEDFNGLEMEWGNTDAMLKLTEMIANREGIGSLLSEGILRAAKVVGKGSEKFAMEIKGQEFPAHDPRGKTGVALGFAISPTGADHLEMAHDMGFTDYTTALENVAVLGIHEPIPEIDLTENKLRQFFKLQQICSFNNSVGMCNLVMAPAFTITFEKFVEMVRAVTGWRVSIFEFMQLGERANVMARCFNVREGLSAYDDYLPDRCFEPLENEIALKGHSLDRDEFRKFMDAYYGMCGWNKNGIPLQEKLMELELDWVDLPKDLPKRQEFDIRGVEWK